MSKSAKFNRADVVEKATRLYWKKGFHGTSMRNLQDVVDLRPGSIYATFGNKENLFKEVLQHYAQVSLCRLSACKKASSSPLEALRMLVKNTLRDSSAPNGMCMLVKSVAELTIENAELLSEAKRLLRLIESAFAATFKEAIEQGEISVSKDPNYLARYLQIQIMGLRTYAHANDHDQAIEALIDDIFDSSIVRG
ncbi:MAG: TetR/AcrR family transcriptional repressor of nem operon [Psychromonas sp.]|jgi:TetR/AcrR family transcriptional repressor of nem operon|uniref:TetR/AcrR family transcriptional regulator n=1 Tax=Psychromonas sp. TaxID=1884585 RepID=UPI0039E37C91